MDTIVHWPMALDEYEQAIEADCVPLGPVLTAEQRGNIKSAATRLFRARDDDQSREEHLNTAARYLRAAGLSDAVLAVTSPCGGPLDCELEALESELRAMLREGGE